MNAAARKAQIAVLMMAGGLTATPSAFAQMVEDHLQHGTDGTATHLFPLNPAIQKVDQTQGGVILLRDSKEVKLDQTASSDDTITNKVNDDYLAAAAAIDLGAGAGIGISHQTLYRKVETNVTARGNAEPVEETTKIQHSQLKLLVELTDGLRAGMAVRYLYKDVALFGNPLSGGRREPATRFRTTLVGYGAGFAYAQKEQFGLAYTYYPPLRGKTDVEGEEKIVVERGEISADAFYKISKVWTGGILYKRWINEVDDLAAGTTAADDQTRISLYGLDLDQYLIPSQMIMVGGDAELSKQTGLRLSVGQEVAEFNFMDLMRYNRIDVRQSLDDKHATVTYYRLRAAVKFTNKGVEIDAGGGYFTRKHEFPERMNGAVYEATGKEVFATVTMKL